MVYKKFSSGCQPCRDWHVKCDEATPACKRCLSRGIECPGCVGVHGGFLFKDQSTKVIKKYSKEVKPVSKNPRRVRRKSESVEARSEDHRAHLSNPLPTDNLVEDADNVAVTTFFQAFLLNHRNHATSRGHFDNLVTLYQQSSPDSPLALATVAMAGQSWMMPDHYDPTWYSNSHLQATSALRQALNDPIESQSDQTLLAALILDFSDQMRSAHLDKGLSLVHHQGAISLVQHRDHTKPQTATFQSLLAATRSNAIRNARLMGRFEDLDLALQCQIAEPKNPAVALDDLIVSALFLQQMNECDILAQGDILQTLLNSLKLWLRQLPAEWHPSIQKLTAAGPAIEVFSAVDIAFVYNQWRCTVLLVLTILQKAGAILPSNPAPSSTQYDIFRYQSQRMLDGILASIPFFTKHSTFNLDHLDADVKVENKSPKDDRNSLGRWYLDDILQWAIAILDGDSTRDGQMRLIREREKIKACVLVTKA